MMKRIISGLTVLCLALSLCACGGVKVEGFYELPCGIDGGSVMTLDVYDGTMLMLLSDEKSEAYRLELWDISSQKQLAVTNADFIPGNGYNAEFGAGGEVLLHEYYEEGESHYVYSSRLESRTEADIAFDLTDGESSGDLWHEGSYSYYETAANRSALVFDKMPERVFITEPMQDEYRSAGFETTIAYQRFPDSGGVEFRVIDYASGKVVNTASLPKSAIGDDVFEVYFAVMDGEYLVVCTGYPTGDDDGSVVHKIFVWEYGIGAQNSEDSAESFAISELQAEADRRAAELGDKYGVTVDVCPDYAPDENKPLYNGETCINEFLCLKELDETLALFPEGMMREMLGEYFEEFRICLTKSITDGFSGAYSTNSDGVLYVVLAADNFNMSNTAHEMMHAAEYRIRDIWSEWEQLNPAGFEYYNDGTAENNGYDEEYFTRSYGQENQLEDRATVFEWLFTAGADGREAYMINGAGLSRKAKLLCEAIREAFPSVSAVEHAVWELPLISAGLI